MFKSKQNEKGEFRTACPYCGNILRGFSQMNVKAKLCKHVLESKLASHDQGKGIAQKELDSLERYSSDAKARKRDATKNDMGLGW